MKRVVFLVSHEGSGSNKLSQILNKNPRIEVFNTDIIYRHPDDIFTLTGLPHKLPNHAAVYMQELLYDYQLTGKALFGVCKFIYLIREAKGTINTIVRNKSSLRYDLDHYFYRLRRIYEMAYKTPRSLFLTWDNVLSGKGLRAIESFLLLEEELEMPEDLPVVSRVDSRVISHCQQKFEKYYYKIKKLNLQVL